MNCCTKITCNMKNVSRTKYITAHGVASCSRKRCGMHRCAVVKVKIDSFFFLFFFAYSLLLANLRVIIAKYWTYNHKANALFMSISEAMLCAGRLLM